MLPTSHSDTRPAPMNPYLGGILCGLLMILSVWIAGKYFGASTTFVRAVGAIEQVVDPQYIASAPYFIREIPKLDWQGTFLLGIVVGSLAGALWYGGLRWSGLPSRWQSRFGSSGLRRSITAFVGGCVAMFGARMAEG